MVEAIRQGDIPGVQLRRRQALTLPPEEVWRWLVEPEKLALWLAEEVKVEPGPEGSLDLSGTTPRVDPPPGPWREHGRTLDFAPPTLWVLAFERLDAGWSFTTRLTLRLSRTPGGSEIDVLQQGFQRLPLSTGLTTWESYRERWRRALGKLADLATRVE
jgi:uncharacterized protein YndB with AHSA1/START domain